jgi:CTP synthase
MERVARIPVDDTNETPGVCIIELGGTVGEIESAPFIAHTTSNSGFGRARLIPDLVSLVGIQMDEVPI